MRISQSIFSAIYFTFILENQKMSRFQRPRYDEDDETLVLEQRADTSDPSDQSSIIYHNPHLSQSIQQQRSRLPISKYRNQILYLVERYRCTVIVGETGSGKSTQITQYLAQAGWADNGLQIGITEPRRVAAITVCLFILNPIYFFYFLSWQHE